MFDTFTIQPRKPVTDAEIRRDFVTALILQEMTGGHAGDTQSDAAA